MQITDDTCTLTKAEVKALASIAHKDRKRPMARVLIDFGRGFAVATDGHRMLLLMAPTAGVGGQGVIEVQRLKAKVASEGMARVSLDMVDQCAWFPDYHDVLARCSAGLLDRDSTGSVAVSCGLATELIEAIGMVCHRHDDWQCKLDGIELRLGRTPLDAIRLDYYAYDTETRVIGLLMPRNETRQHCQDNDAWYRARMGQTRETGPGRFNNLDLDDGPTSHRGTGQPAFRDWTGLGA